MELKTYNYKPAHVEAVLVTKENLEEVLSWGLLTGNTPDVDAEGARVKKLPYPPKPGQYAIKKANGSFEVWGPKQFANCFVSAESLDS